MATSLPRLIAITDLSRWSEARTIEVWRALAERAQPGTVAVQLRTPRVPARRALELGTTLKQIAEEHEQWMIVNDRLDLSLLLGADAVHLGEGSIDIEDARALIGARPVFRACHALGAVTRLGAEALLLSPIAAPRKGAPALGVPAIAEAARALERAGESTRVYALGGMTPEAAHACLLAGARGIAAMEGVFAASHLDSWLSTLAITR